MWDTEEGNRAGLVRPTEVKQKWQQNSTPKWKQIKLNKLITSPDEAGLAGLGRFLKFVKRVYSKPMCDVSLPVYLLPMRTFSAEGLEGLECDPRWRCSCLVRLRQATVCSSFLPWPYCNLLSQNTFAGDKKGIEILSNNKKRNFK